MPRSIKTARIHVNVAPVEVNGETWWQAQCHTGDCEDKGLEHPVKAAAEDEARRHRDDHRSGNPNPVMRPNGSPWDGGRPAQDVNLPDAPDTDQSA